MSDSVKGLPAGYRTTFAQIMRILAMATGTLVAVQFALAGFGAFGSFHKERDWGAHETLGTIIGVFTILVLIAAIVARPGTATAHRRDRAVRPGRADPADPRRRPARTTASAGVRCTRSSAS